jgi:NADH-quinone oxidoreductase subunit L
VVTLPLVLLAIPSLIIGASAIGPMLFGDYFKSAIFVDPEASGDGPPGPSFPRAAGMSTTACSPPFWLALAGSPLAWFSI